jgi:hypothetical protein
MFGRTVTKTFEFFDHRSFAVDIGVRVAHRDADAGVSQEFFHRHNVNVTVKRDEKQKCGAACATSLPRFPPFHKPERNLVFKSTNRVRNRKKGPNRYRVVANE